MANLPPTEVQTILSVEKDPFALPSSGSRIRYQNLALIVPHGSAEQPPVTKVANTQPAASVDQRAPANYDPHAKMDSNQHHAFMQTLKDEIKASPFKNKILLFDFSSPPETERLKKEVTEFFADKSPAVGEGIIKSPSFEYQTDMSIEKRGGMAVMSSTGSTPDEKFRSAHDGSFGALIMPFSPERSAYDIFLLPFVRAGLDPGNEWQTNFSTPFAQRLSAAHEVIHGMVGYTPMANGETPFLRHRRMETMSDIGGILFLAQQGEPDLDRQLQAMIQLREAGSMTDFLMKTLDHNSGEALRELAKDLPRLRADPNFSKMHISDFTSLADSYAKKGLQRDYPHLYTENSPHADPEALKNKTQKIEDQLNTMLSIGDDYFVDKPPTERQIILLNRMSKAVQDITGKGDNYITQRLEQLRTEHPQAFEKAEKEMRRQDQLGLETQKQTQNHGQEKAPISLSSLSAFAP